MKGGPQTAIHQRRLTAARRAHHGQKARLRQRVHHGVNLALSTEEQVLLVFAKRSQTRKGIGDRRDNRIAGHLTDPSAPRVDRQTRLFEQADHLGYVERFFPRAAGLCAAAQPGRGVILRSLVETSK